LTDRRDAKGQMALFTPDTHFVVYMNALLAVANRCPVHVTLEADSQIGTQLKTAVGSRAD
jgi:hypothetical protein